MSSADEFLAKMRTDNESVEDDRPIGAVTENPALAEALPEPDNLRELRAELAEVDAALDGRRFTGRSPDGLVAVTVDGHRRIVSIDIDESALRGSHRGRIGSGVVAAAAEARRGAGAEAQAGMQRALGRSHHSGRSAAPTSKPSTDADADADAEEDFDVVQQWRERRNK